MARLGAEEEVRNIQLMKAKDLFFGYTSLSAIVKATGIPMPELKRLCYGSGPSDVTSWRWERMTASEQDFMEIVDRNRFLIHDASARVASMVQQTIQEREKQKDPAGKFIPLESVEMYRLVRTMFIADRLVDRTPVVVDPDPTQPGALKDVSPGAQQPAPGSQVLDMEKVIRAIQLDKSMQRRLGMPVKEEHGQRKENGDRPHEPGDFGAEPLRGESERGSGQSGGTGPHGDSESTVPRDVAVVSGEFGAVSWPEDLGPPAGVRSEHEGAGAGHPELVGADEERQLVPDARSYEGSGARDLDDALQRREERRAQRIRSGEGAKARRRAPATDPGHGTAGAGHREDGEGGEGSQGNADQRAPESDLQPGARSQGREAPVVHNPPPAHADREDRAGESEPDDEWDVGDGGRIDPFADEYS